MGKQKLLFSGSWDNQCRSKDLEKSRPGSVPQITILSLLLLPEMHILMAIILIFVICLCISLLHQKELGLKPRPQIFVVFFYLSWYI